MLDRAAELETLFAGAAGPGHLRLGASMTIGDYLGPLLIERYARSYPGASVALEVGNTDGVAQKVADFDVDLALIEGQVSNPALEVCDWMGDTLAVFCGSRHPLARTGRATIDRLLKETWVVREPGSGTRQTLDRAMSRYWPRWNIAMELEHTEAIKRAVEAGRSVGCVSRLALRDAFKAGSLREIKVPRLDLSRRFYILLNRRKYRTAGIDAFMQICQEAQVETLD
jgi:DNA-binding transcriptional LysR family regulator